LPQGRISDIDELEATEHGAVEALAMAKKQGKARFTGISTHNRVWLKSMIEDYPQQMEVVLFPYTASSKTLPYDSLFETIKKYDVGVLGIKPFADRALFEGNSALNSPTAEEDSRRARMAIRYILSNPAITAPMAGMINIAQVDNAAKAIMERRELDEKERADLKKATDQMWAKLPSHYEWLRDWQYV
jgi:predicted aldo/keto reductase-like oxidoreductase